MPDRGSRGLEWPARPWALPPRRSARGSSRLPREPANYSFAAPPGASSASGGGGPGRGLARHSGRKLAGRPFPTPRGTRRAALPEAKGGGEVSQAPPPHCRPRLPASSRDAPLPPPPPLRPRGLGHRRRPGCLHRSAPHAAAAAFPPPQRRCRPGRRHLLRRSLVSLEHLPATGHGETETPAAPAGNSPATAGGQRTSGFSAIEQRPHRSFCNPLPAPPSFSAPPQAPPPAATHWDAARIATDHGLLKDTSISVLPPSPAPPLCL